MKRRKSQVNSTSKVLRARRDQPRPTHRAQVNSTGQAFSNRASESSRDNPARPSESPLRQRRKSAHTSTKVDPSMSARADLTPLRRDQLFTQHEDIPRRSGPNQPTPRVGRTDVPKPAGRFRAGGAADLQPCRTESPLGDDTPRRLRNLSPPQTATTPAQKPLCPSKAEGVRSRGAEALQQDSLPRRTHTQSSGEAAHMPAPKPPGRPRPRAETPQPRRTGLLQDDLPPGPRRQSPQAVQTPVPKPPGSSRAGVAQPRHAEPMLEDDTRGRSRNHPPFQTAQTPGPKSSGRPRAEAVQPRHAEPPLLNHPSRRPRAEVAQPRRAEPVLQDDTPRRPRNHSPPQTAQTPALKTTGRASVQPRRAEPPRQEDQPRRQPHVGTPPGRINSQDGRDAARRQRQRDEGHRRQQTTDHAPKSAHPRSGEAPQRLEPRQENPEVQQLDAGGNKKKSTPRIIRAGNPTTGKRLVCRTLYVRTYLTPPLVHQILGAKRDKRELSVKVREMFTIPLIPQCE